MIPNQSINPALFLICSMSPTARNGIETESYRQTASSDEATDQHILESAFFNLIKDVKSLGLILTIDYDEIFESHEKLFNFLSLTSHLLPTTLYSVLKANDKVRTCIGHILDGTLGADETLIQTYLSELAGLDGQDPLVIELVSVAEQYYTSIAQTEMFTDYIRNIYQLVNNERLAVEADPESHAEYRDHLRGMIGRFGNAINHVSEQEVQGELERLQNLIILDSVAPTNFIMYNYLFTTQIAGLPDELKPLFETRWYHYQVSHPWCAAYYQVRKLTPSHAQLVAMYCFIYAIHQNEIEYNGARDKLFSLYPAMEVRAKIDALAKFDIVHRD